MRSETKAAKFIEDKRKKNNEKSSAVDKLHIENNNNLHGQEEYIRELLSFRNDSQHFHEEISPTIGPWIPSTSRQDKRQEMMKQVTEANTETEPYESIEYLKKSSRELRENNRLVKNWKFNIFSTGEKSYREERRIQNTSNNCMMSHEKSRRARNNGGLHMEAEANEQKNKEKDQQHHLPFIQPNIVYTQLWNPQQRLNKKIYRFDDLDNNPGCETSKSLALPTRDKKINNYSMRGLNLMKKLKSDLVALSKDRSIKIVNKTALSPIVKRNLKVTILDGLDRSKKY